jgi:uncharacterized protein (TIGR02147 family)
LHKPFRRLSRLFVAEKMGMRPEHAEPAIDIYRYDDYRRFLKDRFCARAIADPDFSHRKFAKAAGFTNPGFLNDVVKGRRKLSRNAVEKMVAGFALAPHEAEFFRILVRYNQCKSDEEKANYYKSIQFRRSRSNFARLNPAASRYYDDTAYPLIRAAIIALDFGGEYELLGRFLNPPIPANQVKKYIRDLCDWGLVQQAPDGRYTVTDAYVEPSPTLRAQIRQINRKWIIDALDALHRLPREKRHMSTMLVSVNRATAKEIAKKIEQFREEVWDLVKTESDGAEAVMQLNVQYFPRSRSKERS